MRSMLSWVVLVTGCAFPSAQLPRDADAWCASSGLRVMPTTVRPGSGWSVGPGVGEVEVSAPSTDLFEGIWTEEIKVIYEVHDDRDDLVVGAVRPVTVAFTEHGWEYEGWVGFDPTVDGYAGDAVRFLEDDTVDCELEQYVALDGWSEGPGIFAFDVEERIFVTGKSCDASDLGPMRIETNTYRVVWVQ